MEPLPNYGDIMSIADFASNIENGLFTDYDGSGCYATDTEMSNVPIWPSKFKLEGPDKRFTHVVWFNK